MSSLRCRCWRRWPDMPAGSSNVMRQALVAAAELLRSSSRPLLYAAPPRTPAANSVAHSATLRRIDQLNAAFDTYTECEAIADARRVGRALRRLGVERRIVTHPRAKTGWDSLTDSELTVINLIAQGATNRSVADRTAPLPPHGEDPRPQRLRQTRHYLPRPVGTTHPRI